eukprot:2670059-Pleurochrysis_carterae.AAC.1
MGRKLIVRAVDPRAMDISWLVRHPIMGPIKRVVDSVASAGTKGGEGRRAAQRAAHAGAAQ